MLKLSCETKKFCTDGQKWSLGLKYSFSFLPSVHLRMMWIIIIIMEMPLHCRLNYPSPSILPPLYIDKVYIYRPSPTGWIKDTPESFG